MWGIMRGRGAGWAVPLAGTAVAAATLAGCWWPAPGAGPDRRAHNNAETAISVATVGSLHQIWAAATDGPAGDPVTSGVGVHIDGTDNTYAFNTLGAPLWTVPVPAQAAPVADATAVVVDGDRVLAVHKAAEPPEYVTEVTDGRWLDARTGAVLDTGPVADSLRNDVAAGSRTDYLDGIYAETLRIVDTGTGQVLDGGLLSLRFLDSPHPAPTHVTVGVEAVFQSGPGLPADQQGFGFLGVRAFPYELGANNCGPEPAPVFACPEWTTDLVGTQATPVVVSSDQTTLYLGVDTTLHALDARSGEVLWTAALPSTITDAPAVADGWVFVPTSAGQVAAVAAGGCGGASCTPTWVGGTGSAVTVQPAVAGTGAGALVITGGADGGLDAFPVAGCAAAVCAPMWSGSAGAPVTGAPAVNNGQVYVGSEAGIVAFGL